MTPRTPVDMRQGATRRARRALLLLLGVVLLVHLGVAWASRDGLIQDDADSYVRLGSNLAAGHGFVFEPGRTPTSWRAPGYPVLLAVVFWLTGASLTAARIVSAFIWTLTTLITYALGRRVVGDRAALLAAALVGLSPELAGLTGLLWSETLFTCLFLASVWTIVRWRTDTPSWPAAVAAGALVGAAVLTRSTAVVLFPLLWFSAFTSAAPRAQIGRTILVTVLGLTILGGWTARNYLLHDQFVLVESNVGYNLYIGNSPDTPIPFAWQKAATLAYDERYHAILGGHSKESQNALLARAALDYVRENPLRTAALALGKAFDFWLPDFFIARNVRAGSFGPAYARAWLAVLVLTVGAYLLVMGMACRHAWANRWAWSTWFVALVLILYTVPHMLVYGASRYHLPLMPLVMILAAPELLRACQRVRVGGREPLGRRAGVDAIRCPVPPC
ncbi:MAG: glycosyltransferase family 39 protein [Acidobacteriota bacterium]